MTIYYFVDEKITDINRSCSLEPIGIDQAKTRRLKSDFRTITRSRVVQSLQGRREEGIDDDGLREIQMCRELGQLVLIHDAKQSAQKLRT